jgi:hypothetical protein
MADVQIFKFGKRGEDQRLWVENGRVFVFDWSGDSPTTCEDGPLEVMPGAKCTLSIWANSVNVRVPVYSGRLAEPVSCTMSLTCFATLIKFVKDVTLSRDTKYTGLASEILRAESIGLVLRPWQ